MKFRIRLYTSNQNEKAHCPDAVLHISDRPGREGWLLPISTENIIPCYGLVGIETESEELKQRVLAMLSQEIYVDHVESKQTKGGTIRLVSTKTAIVGGVGYWGRAIGLLEPEAHLLYDLDDYKHLLVEMDRIEEKKVWSKSPAWKSVSKQVLRVLRGAKS